MGIERLANAGAVIVDAAVTAVPTAADDLLASLLRESAALAERSGSTPFSQRTAAALAREGAAAIVPPTYTQDVRNIARTFNATRREVNDAIHAVKNDGKIGGAKRNGDVWVDLADGEVYPVTRTGTAAPDSMGNLLRYLS